MNTISIANQKGGTGKTTTAVQLSAALALRGQQVLLIDLDPQASASLHFGLDPRGLESGVDDILLGKRAFSAVVRETSIPNLYLVPARQALANVAISLVQAKERELQLRKRINEIKEPYDFVFIDCAPSLSLLTINALVTSNYLIIPVNPDYLSLEGLQQFLDTVEQTKKTFKTRTDILGILVTMADYRKRITHEAIDLLRGNFDSQVFDTEIKINVRLEEAPSHGITIFDYSPRSAGAECYRRLGEEVLSRCPVEAGA